MKEVFSKIIEELEELHERYVNQYGVVGGNLRAFAVRECIDIVEKIVKQEAEKFGTDTNVGSNGWIPCSERLPETNESVLCWAKSTARGGDVCFVGSCHNGFWFLQSSADTHSFPGQYVIVAWQPLPEPYTKGE